MEIFAMNETWLAHHGIKGQKWGVRRYQNPDGTLTEAGKKKYSKEYAKLVDKADTRAANNNRKNYTNIYNKAAKEINDNDLYGKYNKEFDEKNGIKNNDHDYLNDEEYNKGAEKLWNEVFTKHWNEAAFETLSKDRDFKKAMQLCNKYMMHKWQPAAMENYKFLGEAKYEQWLKDHNIALDDTNSFKHPSGTIIDGYKKQNPPKNAKVDGPQKKEPISTKSFAEKKKIS